MTPTDAQLSYSTELHEQLRRSLNNPFTLHSDIAKALAEWQKARGEG